MFAANLIAVLLVLGAAFYWLRRFYFRFGAAILSDFFLKRKKVAWAMAIRKHANLGKCGGDCACD